MDSLHESKFNNHSNCTPYIVSIDKHLFMFMPFIDSFIVTNVSTKTRLHPKKDGQKENIN